MDASIEIAYSLKLHVVNSVLQNHSQPITFLDLGPICKNPTPSYWANLGSVQIDGNILNLAHSQFEPNLIHNQFQPITITLDKAINKKRKS